MPNMEALKDGKMILLFKTFLKNSNCKFYFIRRLHSVEHLDLSEMTIHAKVIITKMEDPIVPTESAITNLMLGKNQNFGCKLGKKILIYAE